MPPVAMSYTATPLVLSRSVAVFVDVLACVPLKKHREKTNISVVGFRFRFELFILNFSVRGFVHDIRNRGNAMTDNNYYSNIML